MSENICFPLCTDTFYVVKISSPYNWFIARQQSSSGVFPDQNPLQGMPPKRVDLQPSHVTIGPYDKVLSKPDQKFKIRTKTKDMVLVEKEAFMCNISFCTMSCTTVEDYRRHLMEVHQIGNSHKAWDKMECPALGCSRMIGRGAVQRHLLNHLDATRVVCRHCYKSYSRATTLKNHLLRTHSDLILP